MTISQNTINVKLYLTIHDKFELSKNAAVTWLGGSGKYQTCMGQARNHAANNACVHPYFGGGEGDHFEANPTFCLFPNLPSLFLPFLIVPPTLARSLECYELFQWGPLPRPQKQFQYILSIENVSDFDSFCSNQMSKRGFHSDYIMWGSYWFVGNWRHTYVWQRSGVIDLPPARRRLYAPDMGFVGDLVLFHWRILKIGGIWLS